MFKLIINGHDSVKISRSLSNSWPSQIIVCQRVLKDIVTYILLLPFVVATIITLSTSVKCESTNTSDEKVNGRGMKVNKQPPRDVDVNGE